MFAVTYAAEEINLLPGIPDSLTQFYGEVELDALPGGAWKVDEIFVATADYTVRPCVIDKVPIDRSNPMFALIVAALEAHDRNTGSVASHVREQLEGAMVAARADHARELRRA